MKLIIPLALIAVLLSCNEPSSVGKHEWVPPQYVLDSSYTEEPRNPPLADNAIWLRTADIPTGILVMVIGMDDEKPINAAMKIVLEKLGYHNAELEDPAGEALTGEGGILHKESRRKKQSYGTTILKDGKNITVNAQIVSIHFAGEDTNRPYPLGPVVVARNVMPERQLRFQSTFNQPENRYIPTVKIGVRISARPEGGSYAQQTIYLSGVVGLTKKEIADMRFWISPVE